MKKIGIVILNYNGIKDTLECLESLNKIKHNGFLITTYVVDYSHDKLEADKIKYAYPECLVIKKSGNLGFAGGNNVGIFQALEEGADYILLLNNDTMVHTDFLTGLFEFLESKPSVAAVSPKIYFAKGFEFHKDRYKPQELGNVIWYMGGQIDWANMYGSHPNVNDVDKGQFKKVQETDFVTGCCMLISKKALEKVGLLNERLFLYWEDVDWSLRAKRIGYKVYVDPKAYIWHKNAGSSGSGSSLHDYFTNRNRLWMGIRYAPLRTKLALIKQSLVQLMSGREWEKRGIQDAYRMHMGRGSWK